MYPLSLAEFMLAEGSGALWDYARRSSEGSPLDPAMHNRLLDKMRTYMLVGGMPAVVDAYCRHRDLRRCQALTAFSRQKIVRTYDSHDFQTRYAELAEDSQRLAEKFNGLFSRGAPLRNSASSLCDLCVLFPFTLRRSRIQTAPSAGPLLPGDSPG